MHPTLLALITLGMLTRVDHADDDAPLDGIDELKNDKVLADKARAVKLDTVERMDAAIETIKGIPAAQQVYAKRYAELRGIASRYKVDAADLDNTALARAIALKIKPDLRNDASDEYIAAMLDVAGSAAIGKHPASFDGKRLDSQRQDGNEQLVTRFVRVDEEDPSVRRK